MDHTDDPTRGGISNLRGAGKDLGARAFHPREAVTAFAPAGGVRVREEMTSSERDAVSELGAAFTDQTEGIWILISGEFTSNGDVSTEGQVRDILHTAFGYPKVDGPAHTLNVLLDSSGGNLDSAYTTVLYLSAYAKTLNVYVPDRAKSAGTLVAVGADRVFLSPFGQLGPLDTQIPNPRNPANDVSALDCYQSVDYVRDFGFRTVISVLPKLVEATERRISVNELLAAASTFALGTIGPVLQSVTALDFGGWGRTLRIGEHYARKLLEAKAVNGHASRIDETAFELVYGYTHHLFPIDLNEGKRLGLNVHAMDEKVYEGAIKVVRACHKKSFVGFLNKEQNDAVKAEERDTESPEQDAGSTGTGTPI
ncbi:SDH family Clp fold serine proteinase [Actinomadura gamaensis]|uniref:Serine dehydrogenase proteinase n=1 Tax=Actinomadura gamaensis TaxID=1763541 RepID=A0ABV9U8B5_9ACTN